MSETFNLVVVSAGTSDPSSTKLLADRTAQRVTALAERRGATVRTRGNDLLIGKPVVLAATAGTARHALVVDDQMRALFAYLRTLPVPTSLFAAPEDWGTGAGGPGTRDNGDGEHGGGDQGALSKRIDRAAFELVLLMESGFARQVRGESWQSYQHEFGSAGGTELDIDTDSDLMRLATGGSAV